MSFRKYGLVLGALIGASAAGQASAANRECSMESIRAIAPAEAVIDSVKPIEAPVAHCEVLGHIITTNPGPGRVEFSVMLPDSFKNRFYFVGLGAAAGFVPTASKTSDMLSGYYLETTLKLLSEGFVVSGTDTGHKGMMWDFGINNPVARYDHGHRGAHVATVATQAITRSYYNMKDKLYRYHLGCSGGGRMGAMAVTHHPEDYDGAVVSTGFDGPGGWGSLWFVSILQHVIRNPDGWVSPEKLALLERKVADHCAGPDGLVRDVKSCGFKPESLMCTGASTNNCLTAAEIRTVKVVTGRYPVSPGRTGGGFSMTNPTAWSSFLIGTTRPTGTGKNPWAPGNPPASYGIVNSMLRGFYFNDPNFDFNRDLDLNNRAHLEILAKGHPSLGAGAPDLAAYKKAGGKLMLWAPIGENAVPPATEIEYFEHLKKVDPGADSFVRLYLAPGVYHCAGGPGPQDTPDRLLDAVIAWSEQGQRPGPIVANGIGSRATVPGMPAGANAPPNPARTVLLCPYPQTAVYKGPKGAFPYDANNWTCRKP